MKYVHYDVTTHWPLGRFSLGRTYDTKQQAFQEALADRRSGGTARVEVRTAEDITHELDTL